VTLYSYLSKEIAGAVGPRLNVLNILEKVQKVPAKNLERAMGYMT
jgi:hypothetical protein